jgi:ankyrin repeat protein
MFVRISPSSLDSNNKDEGPTTITLDSADEVPFAVISVDPAVTVEAASEKGLSHELVIDWEKWEKLNRRPQIKIRTDHPNAPEMSVVVRRSIQKGDRPTPPPATRTSSLINAARSNNLQALGEAIIAGDDVNDNTGLGGMTALHWAAKNGNPQVAMALVAVKADPNSPNKVGKTPVTLAAEEGHLGVLKMLLEQGGKMEAIDQIGGTPLLWASGLCQTPETVEFLIAEGANVNIIDINGMTPLIWAAGIGKPAVVQLLLDNGADMEVAEIHQNETALMRAARIGQGESLGMLLKAGANLDNANALGHTATMIAAQSAPIEKVRMLVEAGPDLSLKDIRGWTVMDYAKTRTDPNRAEVIEYIESIMPTAKAEPASDD